MEIATKVVVIHEGQKIKISNSLSPTYADILICYFDGANSGLNLQNTQDNTLSKDSFRDSKPSKFQVTSILFCYFLIL